MLIICVVFAQLICILVFHIVCVLIFFYDGPESDYLMLFDDN